MLFEVIFLLFSWLPSPLDKIVFGGICVLLLFAVIKLIAAVVDMLPFT